MTGGFADVGVLILFVETEFFIATNFTESGIEKAVFIGDNVLDFSIGGLGFIDFGWVHSMCN